MKIVKIEAAGVSFLQHFFLSLCNLSDQSVFFLDMLSLLHWPDFMFACSTCQPEAMELQTCCMVLGCLLKETMTQMEITI